MSYKSKALIQFCKVFLLLSVLCVLVDLSQGCWQGQRVHVQRQDPCEKGPEQGVGGPAWSEGSFLECKRNELFQ